GGSDGVVRAAEVVDKRKFTARSAHVMHGVRAKVVQRNYACKNGSKGGRDARSAYVRKVRLGFDGEVVDFRLEGSVNLASGAGKINEHAAGINQVHLEAMRL